MRIASGPPHAISLLPLKPMTLLAFGTSNFFGPDMIIILLIVLVFFGAKRLPELARAFGQSIREFQRGKDGDDSKGKDIQDKESK